MQAEVLLLLISNISKEITTANETSEYYNEKSQAIVDLRKVLTLLSNEVNNQKGNIDNRILRAMHDIGMSSYKDFENTQLENEINTLTEYLYKQIEEYKWLKPLRKDFGKGNPI